MKRYIKTPLKYALPLLFIGALVLVSISGCTSPTSSNQAANNTSQAASTTANATTSASTSASVSPSVTPSADVYQVVVSGPTDSQYGAMWTATVYKNGVVIPCDQLTGQVSWYINGQPSIGGTFGGSQCTMTHDANGLAGSPFQRTNTITATYQGVTSSPVYYTDMEIGQPATATPTPAPVTAQVLILSKPADVAAGSTVTIQFQVFNSVTTAGMPGVTVLIDGAVNTQVITGANGEGSISLIAPQGLAGASLPVSLQLCSAPTTANTVGSCMGADFTVITPPVGNATA